MHDTRSESSSGQRALTPEMALEEAQCIAVDQNVKILFKSPANGTDVTNLKKKLQVARSEIELLRLKLDMKEQQITKLNDKLDLEANKASSRGEELQVSTQGYQKSLNILRN